MENLKMILCYADCRGKEYNTKYPHHIMVEPGDLETLNKVLQRDHVGGIYRNDSRSNDNFIKATTAMMDCDNDGSEAPEEWLSPEKLHELFPDLEFYANPSRHNMTEKSTKGGKNTPPKVFSPRPRWHYYFPLRKEITTADKLRSFKEKCLEVFPALDPGAKDGARFFYGVENPEAVYFSGSKTIDDYLQGVEAGAASGASSTTGSEKKGASQGTIRVGERNQTLYRDMVVLFKKYGGDTPAARKAIHERVAALEEPLPDRELRTIRNSALKFWKEHINTEWDYTPDLFEDQDGDSKGGKSVEPKTYTDLGQATVYAEQYGGRIRYSKSTDWLNYNGVVWEESPLKAQRASQKLTEKQLLSAHVMVRDAQDQLNDAIEKGDEEKQKKSKEALSHAERFRAYVLKRQKSSQIKATLTEAAPMLELDTAALDADPFLLNTPRGCFDLRTGKLREHKPEDYFTKVCAVDFSRKGLDRWAEFLKQITSGDADLAKYLQLTAGMSLIGHVYMEKLIIACGEGGGGKSTYFNTLQKVVGDYGYHMSADLLMVDNRRNTQPELAELRGRRLVVCGELSEGKRLDDAAVKRLCSTDQITAEQKYKAPINFTPSHTCVMYSNFLPRVGTNDSGTWDRVVVVPFRARFRNTEKEIKNYSDVLFQEAGGAVLSWMCKGAMDFIAAGYKIEEPEAVRIVTSEYQDDNDWLGDFITEMCEKGSGFRVPAKVLYDVYVSFTQQSGDSYKRSNIDFKQAMEHAGYIYKKTREGRFYYGLRVKPSSERPDYGGTRWRESPNPFKDFENEEMA